MFTYTDPNSGHDVTFITGLKEGHPCGTANPHRTAGITSPYYHGITDIAPSATGKKSVMQRVKRAKLWATRGRPHLHSCYRTVGHGSFGRSRRSQPSLIQYSTNVLHQLDPSGCRVGVVCIFQPALHYQPASRRGYYHPQCESGHPNSVHDVTSITGLSNAPFAAVFDHVEEDIDHGKMIDLYTTTRLLEDVFNFFKLLFCDFHADIIGCSD